MAKTYPHNCLYCNKYFESRSPNSKYHNRSCNALAAAEIRQGKKRKLKRCPDCKQMTLYRFKNEGTEVCINKKCDRLQDDFYDNNPNSTTSKELNSYFDEA